MAKKNKQPQGRACIFCGTRPLTEEEMWPYWIRNTVPKTGPNKHFMDIHDNKKSDSGIYKVEKTERKLTGPIHSRKLKVVCATCNNGWMSTIESQAKPVLEDMLANRDIAWSYDKLATVAKWAVLRTIICEYANDNRKVVTREDKSKFYSEKTAFEGFHVWIGKRSADASDYHFQSWFGAGPTAENLGIIDKDTDPPNMLTSSFGVGNLLIHVLYHPISHMEYQLYNNLNEKLVKIFPYQSDATALLSNRINWQKIPHLDGQDIKHLGQNLDNNFKRKRKL